MATEIELEHATRYAIEATKLFLYEEYRKVYPHVFGRGVVLKIEPADSDRDYFVPESIRDKCIVVRETRFEDESSCINLACFPVKDDDLRICEKNDEPRWVGIGKSHYFLACQPACRDEKFRYALDTEWKNGKCFEVNPHKKMLAMNPEKLFAQKQKNYGGLEWDDGHLALTKEYCEAYGLQFYAQNKTCYSSQAQDIGEFFVGKTIYRNSYQKIHGTNVLIRDPPPTTDPKTLLATVPPNRNVVTTTPTIDVPEPEDVENLAKEIARDLSIDMGIDLTSNVVEDVLKKRVPKLIESASRNVATKQAVKSAVAFNLSSLAIKLSVLAGKTLTGASNVLAVVGIVGIVLDVIDAAEYDKVLDPVRLAKIVRKLDMNHFDHEITMRVVTPEYVWDHVLSLDGGDDQSRRYKFMSEKIDEYIEALHRVPEEKKRGVKSLPLSYRKPKGKFFDSHVKMSQVVVLLSLCLMLLYDRWIHVLGLMQLVAIVAIESR